MKGYGRFKRFVAGLMVLTLVVLLPGVHVQGASGGTKYVKDFKLYIVKPGSFDEEKASGEAREWFESNGYTMVEGNLNAGASSALTKEVGVYIGYTTTSNRKEAVTDIAVMNEKGNYSEGSYQRILKEQKQFYTDMVSDMKVMLEDYRYNVNRGFDTALQAQKLLNGYVEDDSGVRLGNLLMDISDEDLATLLLQANGQVVLMIQQQLAFASDKAGNTWLDRLSSLGKNGDGYDRLMKQLMAKKITKSAAEKQLDKLYGDEAKELQDKFHDICTHMESMKDFAKKHELDKMSDDERIKWVEDNIDDPEVSLYFNEIMISTGLASYKYGDGNLFNYFAEDETEYGGKKALRKFYPLVASLADSQKAALRGGVEFFTLVGETLVATAENAYDNGKAVKVKTDEKKDIDELANEYDETLDVWADQENPISVYEGVDREMYGDGGIAVTSTAESFSDNNNGGWVEALTSGGTHLGLTIGMGAGAVVCAGLAAMMVGKCAALAAKITEAGYENIRLVSNVGETVSFQAVRTARTYQYGIFNAVTKSEQYAKLYDISPEEQQKFLGYMEEYYKHGMSINHNTMWTRVFNGLKWGLAVAAVLLAVADIALNVVKLYRYYNVDHLPIPHHMVDLSYDEDKASSFVNYTTVRDQNDSPGDVNGNGGKQWLALYQTKDSDAGDPILAPENGEAFAMIVQNGSDQASDEKYSPLHMFGTPNTAQNLTFADGDSGYSYNDDNNGTYLFFRRDTGDALVDPEDEPENEGGDSASVGAASGSASDGYVGTAMNSGAIILSASVGAVAGIFIGVVGARFSRRKRKPGEDN